MVGSSICNADFVNYFPTVSLMDISGKGPPRVRPREIGLEISTENAEKDQFYSCLQPAVRSRNSFHRGNPLDAGCHGIILGLLGEVGEEYTSRQIRAPRWMFVRGHSSGAERR